MGLILYVLPMTGNPSFKNNKYTTILGTYKTQPYIYGNLPGDMYTYSVMLKVRKTYIKRMAVYTVGFIYFFVIVVCYILFVMYT